MLNAILIDLDYDFKKDKVLYEQKELNYDKYRELIAHIEEAQIETSQLEIRFEKALAAWKHTVLKDINDLNKELLDFISCLDETLKEKLKSAILDSLQDNIRTIEKLENKFKAYAEKINCFEDDMSEAFEGAL